MSDITQIRDYAAWATNLDTALEITTVGANVQMTGSGTRFTMSPAAARRLAAVLLAKADEVASRTVQRDTDTTDAAKEQDR